MVFLKYYHEFLYSVEKDGLSWSWSTWDFNTHKMIPCPVLALIWQVCSAYFSWKSWVSWHLIPKEPWASRVYIHREETKLDVTDFEPILSHNGIFFLWGSLLKKNMLSSWDHLWKMEQSCIEQEALDAMRQKFTIENCPWKLVQVILGD